MKITSITTILVVFTLYSCLTNTEQPQNDENSQTSENKDEDEVALVDKVKYWHGENEGVVFTPNGNNTTYSESSPYVNPVLTAHSQKMDQGIFKVNEKVFVAYGFALTSPVN